jgi:hypothetical protein
MRCPKKCPKEIIKGVTCGAQCVTTKEKHEEVASKIPIVLHACAHGHTWHY